MTDNKISISYSNISAWKEKCVCCEKVFPRAELVRDEGGLVCFDCTFSKTGEEKKVAES